MVKQTTSKIVREIHKLNDNETSAVLDYISELLSNRQLPIPLETQFSDDLIASLSEKRENRCARQVVESKRRGDAGITRERLKIYENQPPIFSD